MYFYIYGARWSSILNVQDYPYGREEPPALLDRQLELRFVSKTLLGVHALCGGSNRLRNNLSSPDSWGMPFFVRSFYEILATSSYPRYVMFFFVIFIYMKTTVVVAMYTLRLATWMRVLGAVVHLCVTLFAAACAFARLPLCVCSCVWGRLSAV